MARSRSIDPEDNVDEEIASLMEALRSRTEPAATSEADAELAQPRSGAAVEPAETAEVEAAETAEVEAQSVPQSLDGRATLLPYASPMSRTVKRREASLRVRRFVRRIRRHRGVLAFYLLGLAVAFVVGWLIPTLGKS
jgi:hypothetical protein